MKILVTGGCGFLGSHVCELFASRGWEVVAYDNLTKFEYNRAFKNVDIVRNYNLNFLESIGVLTIVDDIKNAKTLQKAATGADLIVHCAAQPAMTIAIENPTLDAKENIIGTINTLNAAKKVGADVVTCSTIHTYGNRINNQLQSSPTKLMNPSNPSIDENYPILQGEITPLHVSKRTVELYTHSFEDTYGLRAACFRLSGMYGPRQFGGEDHGWVANFAIKHLMYTSSKVFGTELQVRDILYVKDAAEAFWTWYHQGHSGLFNIGGGTTNELSILELFNLLEHQTGRKVIRTLLPARTGDLWWFVTNINKALEDFKWYPTTNPTSGVLKLTEWIEKERSVFE